MGLDRVMLILTVTSLALEMPVRLVKHTPGCDCKAISRGDQVMRTLI